VKRVAFKTVGCRLNQAESAGIAADFENAGYRVVPFGEACDLCIIHTCAITGRAEQKCQMYARNARQQATRVVVTGCAAAIGGEKFREKCGADLCVSQDDKTSLPLQVHKAFGDEFPAPPANHENPHLLPRFETTRPLIKVQDGCAFRCTYCIVPDARGKPHSRPFNEIVDEIRKLGDAGFKEIVLTGANLGCYHDGSRELMDIIRAVEKLDTIHRIRLSSIEVTTTERAIVEHMAGSTKLCAYLHLPLQSGDDGILKRMGRRYSTREYRDLVEYAAGKIPRLGLGTDIMTGFPGEDDAAFGNTLEFVETLPFSNLHVFPYSKRPGTPAATMPDQVATAVKKARAKQLAALGQTKREIFARQFIGHDVEVLIESATDKGATGWSRERMETIVRRPGFQASQILTVRVSAVQNGQLLAD